MSSTPKHYEGNVDVIEFILKNRGSEAAVDFCFDNILKYATRMTRKGQLKEDIGKIEVYASRAVDIFKNIDFNDLDFGYKQQIREILDREGISNVVIYLKDQFGIPFTLDYIQGRLIENVTIRNSGFAPFELSLEIAVNTLILINSYSILLAELENGIEEELEEELQEEIAKEKEEGCDITCSDLEAFSSIINHFLKRL